MTKPVSKPNNATNPTQLDGAADKTSKKSKSAKRVNQPQSDNAANSSDSLNSENQMRMVKSRNVAIDPNLFADELTPSATPEGASEQSGVSSTDSKNESVELSPANSSDEKKSSDGEVALDLAPPMQQKELDSMRELDSNIEITTTGESKESVELSESAKTEESNSEM